ncbi:DUF7504 family protein [Natrialbaceae archaeon A-gly3]
MNETSTNTHGIDDDSLDLRDLPETVPSGSVICIAKPAPLTGHALSLRITDHYTDCDDCRIIVTPSVSAEETIQQQNALTPSADHRLGIIDTTATEHLEALYQENPTVYLPRTGELTQITLALWELEEALSTPCSTPHMIFRSLTPVLAEEGLDRVTNILEQIIEYQRTHSSLTVFSVEYTEHDEETMIALETLADRIIWVEQTAERNPRLEHYRIQSP